MDPKSGVEGAISAMRQKSDTLVDVGRKISNARTNLDGLDTGVVTKVAEALLDGVPVGDRTRVLKADMPTRDVIGLRSSSISTMKAASVESGGRC
eukprot:732301-Amphidinium_carterae.1